MIVGYCVPILPELASFRLRVVIPSRHLGVPCVVGGFGDVTFFFKGGHVEMARGLPCPVVYDVVNDRFKKDPDYRAMCDLAAVVTCSSRAMAEIIKEQSGRDAIVVPDPYENAESPPAVVGDHLLWFGHEANIKSLKPYADLNPYICTAELWSLQNEAAALAGSAVVLLTANNPGASENRPVKAIRAGRFVVAPEDCPESWRHLSEFMWIGDVREGVKWALANREEACLKVSAGQNYIRNRFSPQLIGSQWADLFASTLGLGTSTRKAGSVLTSP